MNLPNLISTFRILAAPVMWILLYSDNQTAFVWLLTAAFFSDSIDGIIARKLHQVTKLGSVLDSYGDSLTILSGVAGLVIYRYDLVEQYHVYLFGVIGLHIIQLVLSLWRYGKPSSFHTLSAKAGALAIGLFILITFHFDFVPWLFYLTIIVLVIDAVEESILVFLIPEWKTDVKGLWWMMKNR
jgi:CDP-diacylglycerol--glycerol-3-phosphate 3-phosphatidyltransferase